MRLPSALLVLGLLAGCGSPHLEYASFQDDRSPDGKAEAEETIRLVFDRPVETLPPASGIRFRPAGRIHFDIRRGTDPREVILRLTGGDLERIQAEGVFDSRDPDRGPTGISVRFSEHGRGGGSVDLLPYQPPPVLVQAVWRDRNGNRVVDPRDEILARFDRPVRPARGDGAPLRERIDVYLPVQGDRLGRTTSDPATVFRGDRATEIRILLGDPVLTPAGDYGSGETRSISSPSGFALNAEPIVPSLAIVSDPYGVGAVSEKVLDLEMDPAIEPFREMVWTLPGSPGPVQLMGHSAVAVSDRVVLITGGFFYESMKAPRFVQDPFVLDLVSGSPQLQPALGARLRSRRAWHTATLFPGADGMPGTGDEVVIVVGGQDDEPKTLDSIECIPTGGRFRATDPGQSLRYPRSNHTTLFVPEGDGGILWIIGGRRGDDPVAMAERFRVRPGAGGGVTLEALEPVHLPFARYGHTATLIPWDDEPANSRILVYGGYGYRDPGAEGPGTGEPVVARNALTLRAPVFIDPYTGKSSWRSELERDGMARMNHEAVYLPARREVLFVGGTVTFFSARGVEAAPETAFVYELGSSPEAPGSFRPAGKLIERRVGHGARLLPDGRVAVLGGDAVSWPPTPRSLAIPERGKPLDSIEIYDPATGTFQPYCLPLPWAASEFVTLGTSDLSRIVIIGGQRDPEGALIQIFEPLPRE